VTRYRAEVVVTLKPGLLDPQGKAVEGALPALGYPNVTDVRVGKSIDLTVEAPDEAGAVAQLNEMCDRFLANPVIEESRVVSVVRAEAALEEAG
jgi:phosphoribosylformylglycinamidine synthase